MPRQLKHPAAATTRAKLLRRGVHVAPFFSPNGRLVLLAIDRGHLCVLIAEITGLSGRGTLCEGLRGCDLHVGLLEPCPSQGKIPFLNPGNDRALSRLLLPKGVHLAPWRVCIWDEATRCSSAAEVLLAIDERHRLVAQMTAALGQRESARRELSAFLDAATDAEGESAGDPSSGYVDPYDDGNPDDCCGEGWKR